MQFLSQHLRRLLLSPSWNPAAKEGAQANYSSGKAMWMHTQVLPDETSANCWTCECII